MSYQKTNFGPIRSQYPDIDIQMKYERAPFKEGGSNRQHDYIYAFAGTIYNGLTFSCRFTVSECRFDGFNPNIIVEDCIRALNKSVDNYKKKKQEIPRDNHIVT